MASRLLCRLGLAGGVLALALACAGTGTGQEESAAPLGAGVPGGPGRPGPAVQDSAENLYVADYRDQVIWTCRKGTWQILAGAYQVPGFVDGTPAEARFNRPLLMAMDGAGVLYVGDSGQRVLRRITPAGAVTTLAGSATGPGGPLGMDGLPLAGNGSFAMDGLAVDLNGVPYVCDRHQGCVMRIQADGTLTPLAGQPEVHGYVDGDLGSARFNFPSALAFLNEERTQLLVADATDLTRAATPVIRMVDLRFGTVSTWAPREIFAGKAIDHQTIGSLAADRGGSVFLTTGLGAVWRVGLTPPGLAPMGLFPVAGSLGQDGDVVGPGKQALFRTVIYLGSGLTRGGILFHVDYPTLFISDFLNDAIKTIVYEEYYAGTFEVTPYPLR